MNLDIATVAALIGDPARAKMLLALMDGLALPAGELAMCANIAPQTASSHLSKLLEVKLLSAEAQGRHRYYRLASPEIGSVMESLLAAVGRMPESEAQPKSEKTHPLKLARTCYNHLAGTLAVEITEKLQQRNLLIAIQNQEYRVTKDGKLWFENFGIASDKIKSGRRGIARQCLDWTERRHHLAGALGAAFLQRLFELKWIVRMDRTRAVRITHKGREQLTRGLGLTFRI